MNKTRETFSEALEKNLPPLQEWKITQHELKKLWSNIEIYLPIKDIFDLPRTIINKIINYNKLLLNSPQTNIFLKNSNQIGGNPFNYIYDIKNKKYYPINSYRGKQILKRYRNLINI